MASLRRDLDGQYPISVQDFKESNPNISFPAQIDFTEYGYHVVFDAPRPPTNELHTLVEGEPMYDESRDIWIQTWKTQDITSAMSDNEIIVLLEDLRAKKLDALSQYRFAKEIAGVTVDGLAVKTDRASQNSITNTINGFALSPDSTVNWNNGDNTWATLNFAQAKNIAIAVFTYVQACRSNEKTLFDQYKAAATPQEVLAIDVTSGWPNSD